MKTTLEIADDVLLSAKERARRENKTVGQVISELVRTALLAHEPIQPFPKRGDAVVTNQLVNKLREGDAY